MNDSLERSKRAQGAFIKELRRLYAAKKYRLYQRKEAFQRYKKAELSSMSNPNARKKAQFRQQTEEGKALVGDFDQAIKNIDKQIEKIRVRIRTLTRDIKEGTKILNKEMMLFTKNLKR